MSALAALEPSGRRRGVLLLVACPFCSEAGVTSVHAHRGTFAGGEREAGCRRGTYRITVDGRGWSR